MLGIRTRFPAKNHGASAKEPAGGRARSPQVVTEEMAANAGFGDAHLQRSLSHRFTGYPVHSCGRPLSMANLESLEMFWFFNL